MSDMSDKNLSREEVEKIKEEAHALAMKRRQERESEETALKVEMRVNRASLNRLLNDDQWIQVDRLRVLMLFDEEALKEYLKIIETAKKEGRSIDENIMDGVKDKYGAWNRSYEEVFRVLGYFTKASRLIKAEGVRAKEYKRMIEEMASGFRFVINREKDRVDICAREIELSLGRGPGSIINWSRYEKIENV